MLSIIYGMMHAGKTEFLEKSVNMLKDDGIRGVWLLPEQVSKSRDYVEVYGKGKIAPAQPISLLKETSPSKNIAIFVDEAQFCNEEEVKLIKECSKTNLVMCGGLIVDFMGNKFPGMEMLLKVADDVHKIDRLCEECNKEASIINARFLNNKLVKSGDVFLLEDDGTPCYRSLCKKCYEKFVNLN